MNISALLGSGAVLSAVMMSWNYIKLLYNYIYGIFFTTLIIEHPYNIRINHYLINNFKIINRNNIFFSCFISKDKLIYYNQPYEYKILLWYGRTPLIVGKDGNNTKIIGIKYLFNYKKLLSDGLSYDTNTLSKKHENRYFYALKQGVSQKSILKEQRGLGVSSNDVGVTKYEGPLVFSPSLLDDKFIYHDLTKKLTETSESYVCDEKLSKLEEKIQYWIDSKQWCKSKSIPWKYGVLLYGKPGTGKTSFIRYIGLKYEIPIIQLDLSTMDNQELKEIWFDITPQNNIFDDPKIILLEDFDNVFDKRRNVLGTNSTLTFDFILSLLDGIQTANGILLFITTNDPSKIDPALIEVGSDYINYRPGRINTAVEIGDATLEQKEWLANKILDPGDVIDFSIKETTAQFQERCIQQALQKKYGAKNEH